MSDYCLFLSTETLDPVSAAIRWKTECAWSHTGFYRLADGWTFSAMSDGKGVAWREPIHHTKVLLLDHTGVTDVIAAALEKAQTQAGCKYDFMDILGLAIGLDLQTNSRFICDKLVFWAFQQVNCPLINHTFIPMEHLTPRDILLSPFIAERK